MRLRHVPQRDQTAAIEGVLDPLYGAGVMAAPELLPSSMKIAVEVGARQDALAIQRSDYHGDDALYNL